MLPLLLMLSQAPSIGAPPPSPPPPVIQPEVRLSVCTDDGLQHAVTASPPAPRQFQTGLQSTVIRPGEQTSTANDLLYREGDTLRLYLTLERRINGCSAPIYTEVGFNPAAD